MNTEMEFRQQEQSKESMTDDTELLTLAAKAAGYQLGVMSAGFFIAGSMTQEFKAPAIWNPLTDDGDALRLAVKLGMSINVSEAEQRMSIFWGDHYTPPRPIVHQKFGDDRQAATRLAIVRAAAEIGKAMP